MLCLFLNRHMLRTPFFRSMSNAIFIDKDGTLIQDVPYNVVPEKIVFMENALDSLHLLQEAGYKIIIISNQPGIALGYFDEEALIKVKEKINEILNSKQINLDGFYYCPHSANSSCDCRKPKPGLLNKAAEDLQIDLSSSWMIGDILDDIEAGNRAGTQTILLNNGNETEWLKKEYRTPGYLVDNLLEAARIILQK